MSQPLTQLFGVDVSTGKQVTLSDSASTSPSSHTVVRLTQAVLSPSSTASSATVHAHHGSQKVLIASLSKDSPAHSLELTLPLRSEHAFSVQTSEKNAQVTLSGYTFVGSAENIGAVQQAKPAAAAAANKRKNEEEQPAKTNKKAKQAAEEEEAEEEDEEEKKPEKKKDGKEAHPIITQKNGLKLQDTKIGTGNEAKQGSQVSIRYRGRLAANGKVFDSNLPRGQPLRFRIGGGDVIPGFDQGVKGMKVGGERTVVIPSELGYGRQGAPPDIPGNATLIFELQLVNVK